MNRLWTYKINALWESLDILLLSMVICLYLMNQKNTLTDNSKTEPSIAVLPFLDMSEGKDQVYFGEGISEEILNALAQLTKWNKKQTFFLLYYSNRFDNPISLLS